MKPNTKGMLIMLLCPLIWSLSGLIAKSVPWPGLCIAGVRGPLTGLTIYAYMRFSGIKPVFSFRTFLIGLTVTGTLFLYYTALKKIPASNAVALQYTEPVFLLAFSALLLGKKYARRDYFVVLAALLGVGLIFGAGKGSNDLWGNLLALLSGACYALTYVAMTDQPDNARLSGLMIGSSLAVFGLFTANPLTLPMNAGIFWTVLISGLFQISVPHILMTKALRLTTPLACSLIATLEMVLNPMWVYLFLKEIPSLQSVVGCVVIMLSVVVWCVFSNRAQPTQSAAEGGAP